MRLSHVALTVADRERSADFYPDQVRSARERFREAGVPQTEWQDDGAFVRVQVATRTATSSSSMPTDRLGSGSP